MTSLQLILVAAYPFVISPGVMLVLRKWLERGQPAGIFNWKTQSWAFMFGDTFSLPLTVWFSLRAMLTTEGGTDLIFKWWWIPLGLFVGVGLSLGFRKMDTAAYIASGNEDRLFGPTKLWHDYFVYFTVGALVFVVWVPALLTGTTDGFMATACLASWLGFGGCDMVRKPDPANMHPRVQDTALARYA